MRRTSPANTSKEPSRFGDPVNHLVKGISTDSEAMDSHGNRLREALTNYNACRIEIDTTGAPLIPKKFRMQGLGCGCWLEPMLENRNRDELRIRKKMK